MFDVLVVGAGITGITLAERYSSQGKTVLLIEKRSHIGGNCYDYRNKTGHLIHKYGPHIFHTSNDSVWKYLSMFTGWNDYKHIVKSFVNGKLYDFPINLNTINEVFGLNCDEKSLKFFLEKERIPISKPKNAKEVVESQVGSKLYNLFFEQYTRKHWGIDPSELDAEVCGRIKIRTNNNPYYFLDKYQGLPSQGYTKMFEKMLANEKVKILLNTEFKDLNDDVTFKYLIYTGPIDEFFDKRFGSLPYRSLRLEFETLNSDKFQDYAVVNYPGSEKYTRITEFKHMTYEDARGTTILKEYPSSDGPEFYPVLTRDSNLKLKRYLRESLNLKNVFFMGRLGLFKYINIDEAVAQSLDFVENHSLD